MRKQRYMDLSMMICPECGKAFPIMRNHGQRRKSGHIKDLWCPYCKEDQKFLEIGRGECWKNNGKIIYM